VARRDESILNLLVEFPWLIGGSDLCSQLMEEKETELKVRRHGDTEMRRRGDTEVGRRGDEETGG
jgi:hypothetical protein